MVYKTKICTSRSDIFFKILYFDTNIETNIQTTSCVCTFMHSKNRHSELVKDPDDFRNYIAFFLDWETETSVTLSLKSFPFKEMFFKVDFILLKNEFDKIF